MNSILLKDRRQRMTDNNAFLIVLKNRIINLIPIGLSAIWLKLTGDGEFDAGKVFGFDSHEWKEMIKFSALMNSKGTNYKNWEGWCSQYGILIEFEKFSIHDFLLLKHKHIES